MALFDTSSSFFIVIGMRFIDISASSDHCQPETGNADETCFEPNEICGASTENPCVFKFTETKRLHCKYCVYKLTIEIPVSFEKNDTQKVEIFAKPSNESASSSIKKYYRDPMISLSEANAVSIMKPSFVLDQKAFKYICPHPCFCFNKSQCPNIHPANIRSGTGVPACIVSNDDMTTCRRPSRYVNILGEDTLENCVNNATTYFLESRNNETRCPNDIVALSTIAFSFKWEKIITPNCTSYITFDNFSSNTSSNFCHHQPFIIEREYRPMSIISIMEETGKCGWSPFIRCAALKRNFQIGDCDRCQLVAFALPLHSNKPPFMKTQLEVKHYVRWYGELRDDDVEKDYVLNEKAIKSQILDITSGACLSNSTSDFYVTVDGKCPDGYNLNDNIYPHLPTGEAAYQDQIMAALKSINVIPTISNCDL